MNAKDCCLTNQFSAYWKKVAEKGGEFHVARKVSKAGDESETDFVYLINSYIGFRFPSILYSSLIQPITLRQLPEPGEFFTVSGRAFSSADELARVFEANASSCTKPAAITPFTLNTKQYTLDVFSQNGKPCAVSREYTGQVNLAALSLTGTGSKNGALLGVCAYYSVLLLPVSSSAAVGQNAEILETIAKTYASTQYERKERST